MLCAGLEGVCAGQATAADAGRIVGILAGVALSGHQVKAEGFGTYRSNSGVLRQVDPTHWTSSFRHDRAASRNQIPSHCVAPGRRQKRPGRPGTSTPYCRLSPRGRYRMPRPISTIVATSAAAAGSV